MLALQLPCLCLQAFSLVGCRYLLHLRVALAGTETDAQSTHLQADGIARQGKTSMMSGTVHMRTSRPQTRDRPSQMLIKQQRTKFEQDLSADNNSRLQQVSGTLCQRQATLPAAHAAASAAQRHWQLQSGAEIQAG